MKVEVDISVQDILESITSHAEAMDIIKKIDLAVADYAFTCELVKYLISSLKRECENTAEPFNISEVM